MNITENSHIGTLVAENYKTASVFKDYGIDFCCNGDRSILEATATLKINSAILIDKLNDALSTKTDGEIDFKSWSLDLLADYIEKKHHRYVVKQLPVLTNYIEKICKVHGDNHPELKEIKTLFEGCVAELTSHMVKEEKILFPAIRKMVDEALSNKKELHFNFGSVQNPVTMMMHEHDAEGNRFRRIADLSNNYVAPSDGCGTYQVTFALLKEFEEDLHRHIHLENNILFPGAVELEKQLNNH